MRTPVLRFAQLAVLATAAVATTAFAHVKWFVQFDAAQPPMPIGEVLAKPFLWLFLVSMFGIYLFFLGDRYAWKKGFLAAFDQRLKLFDLVGIRIMRISAAVFFISLWIIGFFFDRAILLTPELLTDLRIVPWIQLLIGFCALVTVTAPLVGVGIVVLFGAAVAQYGAFHMTDYIIFLGIAYFFLTSGVHGDWRKSAFIVLYACTGLTLLWASIEKFAYPDWTYPMLKENPGMLMGMTPYFYMVLAGFVEFNVTFVLLGAASIVTRLTALGLQAVFILAIFKFGVIDAIGHLMIIAILFVMVVRGPTEARGILVLKEKKIWMEAYFMTGLYVLAFVLTFLAYYGFHHYYYS